MKKCTYCGKEYPDEITTCPDDGRPVAPEIPTASRAAALQEPPAPASGLAITSMVLGIVSVVLLCGPFLGIPAVICGHIALDRSRKLPTQYGGGGFATAGLITGYIGCTIICFAMLGGLLLPALAKAKQKALQISCANNLKQLGLAERIWAGDHNDILPQSFMELTNGIVNPNMFVCPADPNHTAYEFVTPGMSLSNLSGQVIVRCPIHGNELMWDGSVHVVSKRRKD
jgi:hypothetical protein